VNEYVSEEEKLIEKKSQKKKND